MWIKHFLKVTHNQNIKYTFCREVSWWEFVDLIQAIVYYVPRRIMRVITRRETILAGDQSQGIVCKYSILCGFGAFTSFYEYTGIQSEKVEIAVIIAHLTWHFATTFGHFDFLDLV